mgnify:CR=1 FL=1
MKNPEYWKNDSSYFASPKGSERALDYNEAFNQAEGAPFSFRGLPYAGVEEQSAPVGLTPNQQVQQYFQPPPGGWTGGVDANQLAAQNQMQGVSPRPGNMSGPSYTTLDQNAQNNFSEYPINPLTGQPEYLTGDIWSQGIPTSGKGNEIDYYGNETTPDYAGVKIPFPGQSQEELASAMYRVDDPSGPRFGAANQMGVAEGYNHQMANAPMGFGTYAPMGLWNYGPIHLWAYGPMGLWAYGPMNLLTCVPIGL